MIPKIIHYSWFSGEEIPASFKEMMATWQEHLKDYTFVCWDREALEASDLLFAKEAAAARKWAFAADAIRVYAVYNQGGIWLDGDVAVYKSFDSFLHHRMFIGKEHAEEFLLEGSCQHANLLTSHCFGAEAGHPYLKRCLDYYEGRHFITSRDETLPMDMRFDLRILPDIQAMIAREFGYVGHPYSLYKKVVLKEDIHVYPAHYFDGPKYKPMDEVVCIHQRVSAWQNIHNTLSRKMKKGFVYYLYQLVTSILRRKGIFMKFYYVGYDS